MQQQQQPQIDILHVHDLMLYFFNYFVCRVGERWDLKGIEFDAFFLIFQGKILKRENEAITHIYNDILRM